MSLDVCITQKGLFKKGIPLEVILGNELSYGNFDGLCLECGQLGETEFLAYHPAHIGRGFSIQWNVNETKSVTLRLLTPTSKEELRDFYQCVARISSYWKCSMEVDGAPTTQKAFLSNFEDMADFNLRALKEMCRRILSGESSNLSLYAVMFPLVFGKKEAERFVESSDLDDFRDYMHEKQSIDAYYARPQFYRDGQGYFGALCLSEDVRTILPSIPRVPFGIQDPDTGKALEVGRWEAYLYSGSQNKGLGTMPYEELLKRLPQDKVSEFDAEHILIENLKPDEFEKLIL